RSTGLGGAARHQRRGATDRHRGGGDALGGYLVHRHAPFAHLLRGAGARVGISAGRRGLRVDRVPRGLRLSLWRRRSEANPGLLQRRAQLRLFQPPVHVQRRGLVPERIAHPHRAVLVGPGRFPRLYEFATDERGQFLVVQWRAHLYGWDSSLEFQAVLWEDGTFAFRYGAMDGLGYEEVQRY